jgi:hypothetical protein
MDSRKIFLFLIILSAFLIKGCTEDDDPEPPVNGSIVVLMYHVISAGEPANLYERSVADFESDIKYLVDNKITVISFDDLATIRESGVLPAKQYAIITFDDGSSSVYNQAMPLLLKYRMKATFFLWVEKVDQNSFLKSEEIVKMSNYMLPGGTRPFIFGSHGYSHQYMLDKRVSFATDEEYNSFLDYEFGVSKTFIESLVPNQVTAFALPFGNGAGDNTIIAAAVRNGYSFIRTSVHAVIKNDVFDLYNIPSIPILDNTLIEEIEAYTQK